MKKAEQVIGDLIDKQGISFISSLDNEGFPNTRAMLTPRKRDGIKTIFFSTNTSSNKVSSFIDNPKACLYFCNSREFKGVMLKGIMEVLEDKNSKEMLWQEGDTIYYPLGVTDPDYCVLKFTAFTGRYYSNYKSEDFNVE